MLRVFACVLLSAFVGVVSAQTEACDTSAGKWGDDPANCKSIKGTSWTCKRILLVSTAASYDLTVNTYAIGDCWIIQLSDSRSLGLVMKEQFLGYEEKVAIYEGINPPRFLGERSGSVSLPYTTVYTTTGADYVVIRLHNDASSSSTASYSSASSSASPSSSASSSSSSASTATSSSPSSSASSSSSSSAPTSSSPTSSSSSSASTSSSASSSASSSSASTVSSSSASSSSASSSSASSSSASSSSASTASSSSSASSSSASTSFLFAPSPRRVAGQGFTLSWWSCDSGCTGREICSAPNACILPPRFTWSEQRINYNRRGSQYDNEYTENPGEVIQKQAFAGDVNVRDDLNYVLDLDEQYNYIKISVTGSGNKLPYSGTISDGSITITTEDEYSCSYDPIYCSGYGVKLQLTQIVLKRDGVPNNTGNNEDQEKSSCVAVAPFLNLIVVVLLIVLLK